jgi:hypothetical protein
MLIATVKGLGGSVKVVDFARNPHAKPLTTSSQFYWISLEILLRTDVLRLPVRGGSLATSTTFNTNVVLAVAD